MTPLNVRPPSPNSVMETFALENPGMSAAFVYDVGRWMMHRPGAISLVSCTEDSVITRLVINLLKDLQLIELFYQVENDALIQRYLRDLNIQSAPTDYCSIRVTNPEQVLALLAHLLEHNEFPDELRQLIEQVLRSGEFIAQSRLNSQDQTHL